MIDAIHHFREALRKRAFWINILLVISLIFSDIVFYLMELVVTDNIKENGIPAETDNASIPCVIVSFSSLSFKFNSFLVKICSFGIK